MDNWSVAYPEVSFLCLSCAGVDTAHQFGNRLQLANCHHGVITDDANMPRWGQLGCNGFVVFDAGLNVVNPCTSAFLEIGEQAFRDLEGVLAPLLGKPQAPSHGRVQPTLEAEQKVEPVDTGCAGGRCAMPTSKGGAAATATGAVSVASVHNAEMDEEHEQCAAALTALQERPSAHTLGVVLDAIRDHFVHEEELLDAHVYTTGSTGAGGFSAAESMRRSHFRDHQRIIDLISDEMAVVKAGKRGVSDDRVVQVIEAFTNHADLYDGGYAEDLAAALALAGCN